MSEFDSVLCLPKLQRRAIDGRIERCARAMNFSPVLTRVLAGRPIDARKSLADVLSPRLEHLDSEEALADMDIAAQRLAGAILAQEVIGIATDYDMDGLGAHATFRMAIVQMLGHPGQRLRSYIGHRLSEGYGLTHAVANRVLNDTPRPSLLVTADNGSGDEPRIAQLRAAGIDVLVTDHHELPEEGVPQSAFACVNPMRDDCEFPDKAIAGGMVLWLLLRAVQKILIEVGHAPARATRLETLLDYVACSTVADCVSMASYNNRAVVRVGLSQMNALERPCWQAMRRLLRVREFQSRTIAFGVAPRINARSRLADPFMALHFLLARDLRGAEAALQVLETENRERKAIEAHMIEDALERAAWQVSNGRQSITLVLPDGHPGVQGICSSRLVEVFGRPVFLFSPHRAEDGILTGSARTVDGVHVQQLLLEVRRRAPGLIGRFGGHKAAAGAQIQVGNFPAFEALFEQVTCEFLGGRRLEPLRVSDGELSGPQISWELFEALKRLEPTGRGYESALFDGEFQILSLREMGDGTHLRMVLERDGVRVPAVWFRARREPGAALPASHRERAHFLYGLAENDYEGRRRLELRIEARVRGLEGTQRMLGETTNQAERACPARYRPSGLRAKRRQLWGSSLRSSATGRG